MSESESEQETEVYFRDAEVTVHQNEHEEQSADESTRESRRPLFESRSPNRVDPDEEYLESHVQRLTQESDRPRSESTIEKAVSDMVKMQSQMSEVLKNVSDVLVNALSSKQQGSEGIASQLNNNNPVDPARNQERVDLVVTRDRCRRRVEAAREKYFEDAEYDGRPPRSPLTNRLPRRSRSNIKLPSFTGKEEWQVWINRFEAVAERQNWTNEEKLDQLLPKLEGVAAEFVYTQLKRETLTDFEELVAEINNRFRVIQTPKTFAAKFSKRDQRIGETAEEYSAELKCLYDKAYRERDIRTRREDLVRRFLDGLRNEELSWEVEYIKEPNNIDEAVYHVVNCIQTRNRHKFDNGDRKKRPIRKAEDNEDESQDQKDHICRVPGKTNQEAVNTNIKPVTMVTMKTSEVSAPVSKETEMLQQILNKLAELTRPKEEKTQQNGNFPYKKKTLICYACNQENHYARDCPLKAQNFRGDYRSQKLNPNAVPFNQTLNSNGLTYSAEARSQR